MAVSGDCRVNTTLDGMPPHSCQHWVVADVPNETRTIQQVASDLSLSALTWKINGQYDDQFYGSA